MKISLLEYFEQTTLKQFPDKVAVVSGDNQISFRALAAEAKKLAARIVAAKDCLNKPVAVFLPKSIESVISDLAITYSGNVYLNLDVKNPDARISNILQKILPEIIITNRESFARVKSIAGDNISILRLDDADAAQDVAETTLFRRLENIIDADPYCIINTSGSTGTPKGVVLNHKSFVDFTEWAIDKFEFDERQIMGSLSPLYFDIYSFELCLLKAVGATLTIVPEHLAAFPAKILEFLARQKINFIFWVPTIMVNIANLDLFASYELPDLKLIWFAGEVFQTKHLNYWRQHLPEAVFVNLYGPIEITLDCTYYVVEKDFPNDAPIPIGFACRNTDVLILNDEDELATVNEKGELCVRGTSLAMGYYNDAEKTARAFVQNPLNRSYPELIYRTGDVVYQNEAGEINFVGRRDFQIKHLGYRIDLSEIEHVIVNTWGKIRNACVLYDTKMREICLLYEGDNEISVVEFRKDLIQLLPKYTLPTSFRLFRELPRNPNGKIDRNLLASMLSDEVSD